MLPAPVWSSAVSKAPLNGNVSAAAETKLSLVMCHVTF
jgi:hypothetical protein